MGFIEIDDDDRTKVASTPVEWEKGSKQLGKIDWVYVVGDIILRHRYFIRQCLELWIRDGVFTGLCWVRVCVFDRV